MQLTASIYVALSALLVLALAAQVILLRRSKRIGLGDGGDTRLACAIRAMPTRWKTCRWCCCCWSCLNWEAPAQPRYTRTVPLCCSLGFGTAWAFPGQLVRRQGAFTARF